MSVIPFVALYVRSFVTTTQINLTRKQGS